METETNENVNVIIQYIEPVIQNPLLSQDFLDMLENIPHSIPILITMYRNEFLNLYEKEELCTILRSKYSDINYLLEFYVNDIYPGDYYFAITYALKALVDCNGIDIINKIKTWKVLSNEEDCILDNGSHSGCSFYGLKYWLNLIFNKMQGDKFDNYHLIFDKGIFERIHYLFKKNNPQIQSQIQTKNISYTKHAYATKNLLTKIKDLEEISII